MSNKLAVFVLYVIAMTSGGIIVRSGMSGGLAIIVLSCLVLALASDKDQSGGVT